MEFARGVLRFSRPAAVAFRLRAPSDVGTVLATQHRWCSGWRKPRGTSGPGGAKYRPPSPRVTAADRRAAEENKWEKRHIPKGSSVGGKRMTSDEVKEGLRERMLETSRSVGGTVTEQKFPVAPVYPRTVGDETTVEQKAQREGFLTARRRGWMNVGIGLLFFGGVFYMAVDAMFFSTDKYFVPVDYYSMPQYRDRLKIKHVVYLDMACDGEDLGRIHIGLFDREAPNFCENFYRLCTGDTVDGRTLKGSLFFKCNNASLWGGDATGIDGRDGLLALDRPLPPDSTNNLSMPFGCYIGGPFTYKVPDMNDSVFFISLEEERVAAVGDFTCWGMVLKGWVTVERIAQLPRQPFPYFLERVEVTGCGVSELSLDEEAIENQVRAYHKARTRRFLATHKMHAQNYETAQWHTTRKRKLEAKREQIRQELEQRKEQKASE